MDIISAASQPQHVQLQHVPQSGIVAMNSFHLMIIRNRAFCKTADPLNLNLTADCLPNQAQLKVHCLCLSHREDQSLSEDKEIRTMNRGWMYHEPNDHVIRLAWPPKDWEVLSSKRSSNILLRKILWVPFLLAIQFGHVLSPKSSTVQGSTFTCVHSRVFSCGEAPLQQHLPSLECGLLLVLQWHCTSHVGVHVSRSVL